MHGTSGCLVRLVVGCVLYAAAATGCAHGRFVGTMYVPSKMYGGDELPDERLATVLNGVHLGGKSGGQAIIGGDRWFAVVHSVDGRECGSQGCTSVVQVLPGKHVLGLKLNSAPWLGGGSIHWKQSKEPFTVEAELELGIVYAAIPVQVAGGRMGAQIRKLCASQDHIDSGKAFLEWGETSCKQPQPEALPAVPAPSGPQPEALPAAAPASSGPNIRGGQWSPGEEGPYRPPGT